MDGLSDAIVYSLFIDTDHFSHHNYKQIKQSISTIRNFSDIDIYLFFSSPNKINDNFFLKNNVNIIEFENNFLRWTDKIPESPWNKNLHHRWINILNFFNSYNYDRILYLDTDTIFYKSPEELLEKYNENIFYVKKEIKDPVTQVFISSLGIDPAINDGQIIISRSEINKIKDKFETIWVDNINKMTDIVYETLSSETDHVFFWNVSQYAIFKIIRENLRFKYFDDADIVLGLDYEASNKENIFVHHYFSGNMKKYFKETYDKK